jgi:hypothetical protein
MVSKVQLSVTVSPEKGRYVDEVSAEYGIKKSAVVEHALALAIERRKELLMREGYEEMAEHDAELLKDFERIDSETPLPEYAEK